MRSSATIRRFSRRHLLRTWSWTFAAAPLVAFIATPTAGAQTTPTPTRPASTPTPTRPTPAPSPSPPPSPTRSPSPSPSPVPQPTATPAPAWVQALLPLTLWCGSRRRRRAARHRRPLGLLSHRAPAGWRPAAGPRRTLEELRVGRCAVGRAVRAAAAGLAARRPATAARGPWLGLDLHGRRRAAVDGVRRRSPARHGPAVDELQATGAADELALARPGPVLGRRGVAGCRRRRSDRSAAADRSAGPMVGHLVRGRRQRAAVAFDARAEPGRAAEGLPDRRPGLGGRRGSGPRQPDLGRCWATPRTCTARRCGPWRCPPPRPRPRQAAIERAAGST